MKSGQSGQVKKTETPRTAWLKSRFLEKFVKYCIVGKAARAAGISRSQVYNWLEGDKAFARRFEYARKDVLEMLEAEAIRRASKGVNKPVFYLGEKCGAIREYSDTLLIFLLKANDPEKYRERHEITGPRGGPIEHDFDAKGRLISLLARIAARTGEAAGDKESD